jgi:hypothetical protein
MVAQHSTEQISVDIAESSAMERRELIAGEPTTDTVNRHHVHATTS